MGRFDPGGIGGCHQRVERGGEVGIDVREFDDLGALGGQDGRLARVGKEADGRACAKQHDATIGFEALQGEVGGRFSAKRRSVIANARVMRIELRESDVEN